MKAFASVTALDSVTFVGPVAEEPTMISWYSVWKSVPLLSTTYQ